MKLACVVHRFGADIAGGSEAHCRQVAERLAARHDVTILTTCARDHMTWRNAYPPGESRVGPLQVRRFPVARERSMLRFRDVSERAFSRRASDVDQEEWFRENGPDTPDLVAYLASQGAAFNLVLFWAFRYAEVFFGLPAVAERAVLVPTAEEDPLIRIDVLGRFFERPAGFIFLTPEEQMLIERHRTRPLPPSCIVGSGLEPVAPAAAPVDLDALGVRSPFLLYLGRIDPNKGCATLLKHFLRYAEGNPEAPQLVMAGPANMPIPSHPLIKALGFVSDTVREGLLGTAAALVVPSPYESLSLVLLEGWNHGRAALVNRHCAVLKGQVSRANGGLFYGNYEEFAHALGYLLSHPEARAGLGAQGLDYVNREYRWPHVMARIEDLLTRVGPHAADRIPAAPKP